MQWDNSSHAGFTEGNSSWIPVNSDYPNINVAVSMKAEVVLSLLHKRKWNKFTQFNYFIDQDDCLKLESRYIYLFGDLCHVSPETMLRVAYNIQASQHKVRL